MAPDPLSSETPFRLNDALIGAWGRRCDSIAGLGTKAGLLMAPLLLVCLYYGGEKGDNGEMFQAPYEDGEAQVLLLQTPNLPRLPGTPPRPHLLLSALRRKG